MSVSRIRRRIAVAACVLVAFLCSACAPRIIEQIPLLDPEHKHFGIHHDYGVEDPQFERSIGNLLGPPVVGGNSIVTLVNGNRIFPEMLEAIRGAKKTINFETFIYWSGDIGEEFAKAFAERARAGVKVSVVLDWIGMSKLDEKFVSTMKNAGVRVELYHQLHWYDPRRFNDIANLDNRTHRKLLIVDGRVGFTGGVGIADEWNGDARNDKEWRDTHYRIEGPVVSQLQSAFIENWMEAGGELLHGDDYFPELQARGPAKAQAFRGSPSDASDSIELMYRMAIVSATRSIKLSSAYFVPDRGIVKTLIDAAKRGVKIEILVPGQKIDHQVVRSASRAVWGDLLQAGVKIYEYQPTMFHCKVLVIDGFFTSVGSTNFDSRSFHLNDEVNLNIFDNRIAEQQEAQFEQDRARAKEISLEDWKNRPLFERLGDNLAALFGSEL
ncbi:MAG: phospholipase D-like domain-containing protein [Bdellovibrionota bacterium]